MRMDVRRWYEVAGSKLAPRRRGASEEEIDAGAELQSQGVHHITLVGAGRQTSIDFWEGVLGMPFIFEQPNLDKASESHLYFDPGDGRLITIFTDESRTPVQRRTPTEPGCVHHIAFSVSRVTFLQAVARLDERGIKHSGVKDRGFMDSIYFEDPLGLLIELASYRFEPPAGFTHADVLMRGAQAARRARRLQYRRSASCRRDPDAGRVVARDLVGRPDAEESILTANKRGRTTMAKTVTKSAKKPAAKAAPKAAAKPAAKAAAKPAAKAAAKPAAKPAKAQVGKKAGAEAQHAEAERQQHDRSGVRARGRARCRRDRRLGPTRARPNIMARNPAHLTPMIEDKGLPRGVLWESCAIMQYLANKHGLEKFYPKAPAKRAMIDSAMFYLIGTLYPYVARATYPALGFPQYAGEVGAQRCPSRQEVRRAEGRRWRRSPSRWRCFTPSSGTASRSSAARTRRSPTSAWRRRSSSWPSSTIALPKWAKEYVAAIEKKLGKAYAEPAGDVRGYIAYVKSQARAQS